MCLSSDGTAYLTGSDNLGQPWKNMQLSGITGEPQAVPISNYVAPVVTNSRGLLEYCLTTPKEVGLTDWTAIPDSSGLQDWAAFYIKPSGLLAGNLYLIGPDYAGTDLTCLRTPVSPG